MVKPVLSQMLLEMLEVSPQTFAFTLNNTAPERKRVLSQIAEVTATKFSRVAFMLN